MRRISRMFGALGRWIKAPFIGRDEHDLWLYAGLGLTGSGVGMTYGVSWGLTAVGAVLLALAFLPFVLGKGRG
jgi:hypothetical protein